MKPSYFTLKSNHYSSNDKYPDYLAPELLYEEIGYDYDTLYAQNHYYENTCAIRMSLALIKSGVSIHGRLKIKAGRHKGGMLEPGAKLLADQLVHVFEKPVIIRNPSSLSTEFKDIQGVIFLNKITGYGGGHIDLIESSSSGIQVCHSGCYSTCLEAWFWPLS